MLTEVGYLFRFTKNHLFSPLLTHRVNIEPLSTLSVFITIFNLCFLPLKTSVFSCLFYERAVLTGYNPVLTGYNPVLTGYNPVLTGYNPVLTGYSPVLTRYSPVLTGYSPVPYGCYSWHHIRVLSLRQVIMHYDDRPVLLLFLHILSLFKPFACLITLSPHLMSTPIHNPSFPDHCLALLDHSLDQPFGSFRPLDSFPLVHPTPTP